MKKKLLICAAFVVVCMTAQSQNALKAGPANQPKRLTTAEANALNGTANPTINGRPYSEYKAEQDAIKQQQSQQQTSKVDLNMTASAVKTSDGINQPVSTKPAPAKTESDLKAQPVENKVVPSSVTTVQESNKTTGKLVTVPLVTISKDSPETETKQAEQKATPAVTSPGVKTKTE